MIKVGKTLRRFLVQSSAQCRVSYNLWRLDRALSNWINRINSKDGDCSTFLCLCFTDHAGNIFPSLNLPCLTCPWCLSSLHQAQAPSPHRYPCRCWGPLLGTAPPSKAFPSLGLVSSTAWASPSEVLQYFSPWWFSSSVVFWFKIYFLPYFGMAMIFLSCLMFVVCTLCSWAYSFLPLMFTVCPHFLGT